MTQSITTPSDRKQYNLIATLNGNPSVTLSAETPADLGTKIGELIEEQVRPDTDIMFTMEGPISRRIINE